jgi:hypothetical protein
MIDKHTASLKIIKHLPMLEKLPDTQKTSIFYTTGLSGK